MPTGMKFLYCCQLAMVILAPTGAAPWFEVSFTHWSISLRSVDCAHTNDGRANSNRPVAITRARVFIPVPSDLAVTLREPHSSGAVVPQCPVPPSQARKLNPIIHSYARNKISLSTHNRKRSHADPRVVLR